MTLLPGVLLGAEDGIASSVSRPNIVLLIADDLGYGETGCQGNTQIPTPAIDRLAADGIRMTQGYVTAAYCSPSRAGLLSGRYQMRFGHELNPVGDDNLHPEAGMPARITTLAEVCRQSGYRTSLVGKWHLGAGPGQHPLDQGFDTFYGFLHEGHYYVPDLEDDVYSFLRRAKLAGGGQGRHAEGTTIYSTHLPYDEPDYDLHNPILRGRQPIEEPEYFTDAVTREACRVVADAADDPFLLVVSYSAVHSPMQAPVETVEKYGEIADVHRRIFAGMLHHLDASIGAIRAALTEQGLDENTLIIFLSDNGGPTRELTSSNLPLRGGKGMVYEGGLRVPMIVSWPARLEAGQTYDRPVMSIDWLPTIAAAIGQELNQPSDGVDLLPFLTGELDQPPHETLFWRMGNKTAIRVGDWKAIGTRTAWVHGAKPNELRWELYDLASDLEEASDLAARRPEVLAELQEHWQTLNEQMVAPRRFR